MNFREGMRRLGVVLGVLGCGTGGFWSYFRSGQVLDGAAKGLLQETLFMDCAILLTLPVIGFLVPWGAVRLIVWIWEGFSN
jgi:hypothetical protein